MLVYRCMCMCVCMCICVCLCVFLCMYVCVHVCACAPVCVLQVHEQVCWPEHSHNYLQDSLFPSFTSPPLLPSFFLFLTHNSESTSFILANVTLLKPASKPLSGRRSTSCPGDEILPRLFLHTLLLRTSGTALLKSSWDNSGGHCTGEGSSAFSLQENCVGSYKHAGSWLPTHHHHHMGFPNMYLWLRILLEECNDDVVGFHLHCSTLTSGDVVRLLIQLLEGLYLD